MSFLVKLKGHSVLEALVASLIFFIAFSIVIEGIARVTFFNEKLVDYVLFEQSIDGYINNLSNKQNLQEGVYDYPYSWGIVRLSIESYNSEIWKVDCIVKVDAVDLLRYRCLLVKNDE